MIKVASLVESFIREDDIAMQAMQYGIMNFSEYARVLHPKIEKKLLKKVDIKTIVTALSRLSTSLKGGRQINTIKIKNLSIYSDLTELTVEKTANNREIFRNLHDNSNKSYFVTVESLSSISIIATKESIDNAKKLLHENEMLVEFDDLTGISLIIEISSSEKPLTLTPNTTYEILSKLAVKNINVVEIISTANELTLIIEKSNTDIVLSQLKVFL